MQIRTILYQYIKTLIKHVFLLNFTYELLMILEVLLVFRKTLVHIRKLGIRKTFSTYSFDYQQKCNSTIVLLQEYAQKI